MQNTNFQVGYHGFNYLDMPPVRLATAIDSRRKHYKENFEHRIVNPAWVLDYLWEGEVHYRLENSAQQLRAPGTAHIYPPNTPYYEQSFRDGNLHSSWITFEGEFPFLRKKLENPAGFLAISDPERELGVLLKETIRASCEGNNGYWRATAKFCEILDKLTLLTPARDNSEECYNFQITPAEISTYLGDKVRSWLEANYQSNPGIPEIAAKFNMSISNLSHRYRAETGESIMQTLIEIRLKQSLVLLLRGEKLKNIAQSSGFGNEFYYSRRFKAFFGVSPRQWLQNYAK